MLYNKRVIVLLSILLALSCFLLIQAKTKEEIYQEKLARLKPDSVNGHYQLGIWCLRNKLLDEAKTQFNKVLELKPNHKLALKKLEQLKELKVKVWVEEFVKKYGVYKGVLDKPGADKEKLPWEKARNKETEHFIVKTNLSVDALNDTCILLEGAYPVWLEFFRFPEPKEKCTALVVKNRQELEKVCLDLAGEFPPPTQGGRYIPKELSTNKSNKDYLLIQYVLGIPNQKTSDSIVHEGTHYVAMLVSRQARPSVPNLSNQPKWLAEGLATYFGQTRIENKKFVFSLDKHWYFLLKEILANDSYIKLKDLIHTEIPGFSRNHYAVAWGLVHFMMCNEYEEGLKSYMEAWKQGKIYVNDANKFVWIVDQEAHIKLFEECMGVPIDQLEEAWRKYILKLK